MMSVVRPMKRDVGARDSEKHALPSRDFQELWFATRRRKWRSLVVVPASPGSSALHIAQALGEVGSAIRMSPVQVINAEGMDLERIARVVSDITGELKAEGKGDPQAASAWTSGPAGASAAGKDVTAARSGPAERATIIAIEAVAQNPLLLPLALAADAVLLCVEVGRTKLDDAHHAVELIGRDRIIGTVLLRPG
jgi:hypothetical protein